MADTPQPAEGQCAFFLSKKKRFCRFRPNQGQKYCPEHACVLGVELERKRIVCPLNPKHTCYEDNLDKHLKKCNSRKRRNEDYYEEGINAGTDEGDTIPNTQTAVKATDTQRLKSLIEKVNQLYEEHIGQVEVDVRYHQCLEEEMKSPGYGLPALRHRRQQASLIGQLEGLGLLGPGHCYVEMGAGKGQLSHWVRKAVSCHDDAAFLLVDRSSIRYKVDGYHKEEEKVQFERIKMDIEHLHLGKVPMVANSRRPLVAMGKHLCGAATDLTLRCLMETTCSRSTNNSQEQPSTKKQRLEADPPGKPGGAYDTKCQAWSDNSADQCEGAREDRIHNINGADERQQDARCSGLESTAADAHPICENSVAGVVIALCCHHQCTWKAYVGKEFMRQCGVTAADFQLLTRLTSWAVCGWRDLDGSFGTGGGKPANRENQRPSFFKDDSGETNVGADDDSSVQEDLEHNTTDLVSSADKDKGLQLSEKEKETVGWRCKRLIDYGRVQYLHSRGLHSDLKIYIDTQQTPENVLLMAIPEKDS